MKDPESTVVFATEKEFASCPARIEDFYTLTPLQQGMLFHSLYAPMSEVYLRQIIYTLHEELNATAFKRAWERVIERHAIFRTSIRWEGLEEPIQEVHQSVRLPFEEQDWRDCADEEQHTRVEDFLRLDRQRGIQVTESPLLRLTLLRFGDADYRLIWTFHHVLSDGHSDVLTLREVFAFYAAFAEGQDLELEQPLSYKEHSEWLKRQDLSKAETFWRQALGKLSLPNSPLTRLSPEVQSGNEGVGDLSVRLPLSLTSTLRSLAQQHELTLNTLVQGAWALLLSRYSGEEYVVFGALRACRRSALDGRGAEAIVGPFVNTVPVCVRVPPDAEVLPWLKELREQWVAMREYEHTPLVKIQEWVGLSQGRRLFDSMISFSKRQMNSTLQAQGGNWLKRELRSITARTNYPLTVTAYGEESLLLTVRYHRANFEQATVQRMLGHFETLLKGIIADPQQRLSELPLLTRAEEQQLLVEWNDTARPFPQESCIHHLFEEQVERTPNAPALSYEREQLSYAELNKRANRLAHYLRAQGVGPEVLVGICMERSVELVIALLAVLKAGGAYLPLDPGYPLKRLAFMLNDAQPRVLITRQQIAEQAPAGAWRVVNIDSDGPQVDRYATDTPAVDSRPEHLAYVIYTSGSTGQPKGVEITHRSLLNLVGWHQRDFGVTVEDRASHLASVGFDAAVWEVWPYLAAGASLHLTDEVKGISPEQLRDWLVAERITICFLPTALAESVMTLHWPRSTALRILLTGADTLHRYPSTRLPFELVNNYGPTECTVIATSGRVLPGARADQLPTIGRPIRNTTVYVLDGEMRPVPVGVRGELYIGGEGLARGYLHRAELTAERFIPHPFSSEEGSRLYKTGDLARYLSNGCIEFLGRLDQQVKVRGYRIELGEVEAVLSEQEGVREAVVVMREDEPGDKRLVGYVVGAAGELVSGSELRRELQERLPEYMVPAAIVMLDKLPLTANGKVNRQGLPAPDGSRPELAAAYVEPRNGIEEVLAGIWSEVLRVERVGIYDNFFELGGHSLLATQVISRVRQVLEAEVGLRTLFERPTVAGLAESIEQEGKSGGGSVLPGVVAAGREQPLPLSFAQQRLWFLDQVEAGTFYNIPVALHLTGHLDTAALEAALAEIVRRHEALRTSFPVIDGQPVQLVSPAQELPLPVTDLSHLPEAASAAERLAQEEAQQYFDLAAGPLFRARLLRLQAAEHVLVLNMHHIVSDGWSIGVLIKELSTLYTAYAQQQPSPLAELPIQYADYAVWQRQWMEGEVLQEQLQYWREQLRGAPAVLELPTDHARPAVQSFRGGRHSVVLSRSVSEQLKVLSRREGVTLFMSLLAAWQVLLSRYSGQEEIVVGSPIAGRTRGETEGLIGFFINTLVLRGDLSGDPSFQELLQRVKEVCLGGYAHQEVPFEKLVEELQPERSLSHNPLFQVMFVLQNRAAELSRMGQLSLQLQTVERATAKFDLSLAVAETEQELRCILRYSTDLFNNKTIRRMLGHFETLLESVVKNPDARLSAVTILGERERGQLLEEWNDTTEAYPSADCIQEAFEAQVERSPDITAVVLQDERVSYGALNERANQLAHYLQREGVGPEVRVGIYMERSIEMIVAVLAVLKAGGAYVPLDPQHPPERISFMVRDAGITVVLREQSQKLPPDYKGREISLDEERERIGGERVTNVVSGAVAENLAYVIYTSGSTGKPKGVLIQHRSALNLTTALQRTVYQAYAARPLRVSLNAPLAFDASVKQILTLLLGCTLYIVPDEVRYDRDSLLAFVERHKLNVLDCTPSQLTTLIDQWGEPSSYSPQVLLVGGEAVDRALWQKMREVERVDFYNVYGPTECTVDATICRARESGETPNIGRPVANTQVYLLDRLGQLVAVGVPGELHIGGAGLARGYLDRPDLTAERFIPHPFSSEEGSRLYKTGDLARYLSNGCIEFLGRLDQQVKVRGYRIELGEVEAELNRHLAIREAILSARADAAGHTRLLAYLTLLPEQSITSGELRAFLKKKLPDYMIPSTFVLLDKLPLSPNGKVDRKALPVPSEADLESAFVAPRTPLEQVLAGVWEEVLKVDRVGIHDSFFELGGHSLLATQAISRLRQILQVDLPLRNLFEMPRVAELAEQLINDEAIPGQISTAAGLRIKIAKMSPDEVQAILQNKKKARG